MLNQYYIEVILDTVLTSLLFTIIHNKMFLF